MNEYIEGKCPACKFWAWFENTHEYGCEIKGCWHGSKYVEFSLESFMKELDRERKKNSS